MWRRVGGLARNDGCYHDDRDTGSDAQRRDDDLEEGRFGSEAEQCLRRPHAKQRNQNRVPRVADHAAPFRSLGSLSRVSAAYGVSTGPRGVT